MEKDRIIGNAKISEKFIYDHLIYDFRTRRHLKVDYDLSGRAGDLLVNSHRMWALYVPNSINVKNGIVTINFYERYIDPHNGIDPVYIIEFDTNIWVGEYKSRNREKRLSKILDK